jgi:lipopolysaccharide biosynthesis protein
MYLNSKRIILFTHCYYPNSGIGVNYELISCNDILKLTNFSNLSTPQINSDYIISSPNQGKDIGGKLALIDLTIKLKINADYYIFLHDKKSPHTTLGDIWREKLFKIIEPQNIEKIKNMFDEDDKLGIVAAKEFIVNEFDETTGNFNCTSNSILKELIKQYKLNLTNFDFVGGTMFWVKTEIFNNFFSRYNPLEIRATLEKGNVLDHDHGTYTHAWERMFSWIATDQGYKIKGI